MKICILTIATNKYIQFVERLLDNIEENFLNGHEIECLLFTDHEVEASDNVRVCQIDHETWPMPTLKRYNYFIKEKEFISQFDYCFYFDVDMGIVDTVGDEVLGDLVATMHPYQSFYPKEQRSYDRNPKSLAYVPVGEEGENYYAGGFNGGSTKRFLEMAEILADRVTKDLENNVIALWHDESHMNRYLIDNPPTLSLTPSYCFAEEQMQNIDYPFSPKIIALKKNHQELREPTQLYWIETYKYTAKFFKENPQYKIGAEVGIAGGEHIEYLLKNTDIEKIYGVDPFDPNLWNVPVDLDLEKHYKKVVSKLSRFGSRSEVIRKTSVEGANNFEDESLDFVFIDAGHDYDNVKNDIKAWLPKIKITGIIMGHDWESGFPGVERAVKECFGQEHLVTQGSPIHVWYITKKDAIRLEKDHSDLHQPEEG